MGVVLFSGGADNDLIVSCVRAPIKRPVLLNSAPIPDKSEDAFVTLLMLFKVGLALSSANLRRGSLETNNRFSWSPVLVFPGRFICNSWPLTMTLKLPLARRSSTLAWYLCAMARSDNSVTAAMEEVGDTDSTRSGCAGKVSLAGRGRSGNSIRTLPWGMCSV